MKRLIAGALLLWGCSGPPGWLGTNQLTGSVSSSQDLTFDEVDVRKFPAGDIQVRYLRKNNGNQEIVAQVSVLPASEGIKYGEDIDLKTHNGAVNRVVQEGSDYPPLKSGKIRFDSGAVKAGDSTRGSFSATFDNDKTLNGSFEAALQEPGG